MPFELRLLTIGVAAFAATGLVVAVAVPFLASRVAVGAAVQRARTLAWLRLLPSAAAVAAGSLVTVSFLVFEPRHADEYMGWVIPGLALLGTALLGAAAWRVARLLMATRRLTTPLLATASPVTLPGLDLPALLVTSDFPIVAVVGFSRPRLLIARSVLASCTPDELRAILAHELGHVRRRDNLRRLFMAAAPDVLAWLPASSRLASAWRTAAEEAADDDAAGAGSDARLCLASALVKVARLAVHPAQAEMLPASTIYCGENLDGRVRRLLEPDGEPAGRAPHPAGALAAVAGLTLIGVLTLEGVHALVEVAIHRLP